MIKVEDTVSQRKKYDGWHRLKGEVIGITGKLYRVLWEDNNVAQVKLSEVYEHGPHGEPFVWGEVLQTYYVGPYAIVEYQDNKPDNAESIGWEPNVAYHYYVSINNSQEFRDTNHSTRSLDRALVEAVAFRNEWIHRGINCALNSRAAGYFMRGIGPDSIQEVA